MRTHTTHAHTCIVYTHSLMMLGPLEVSRVKLEVLGDFPGHRELAMLLLLQLQHSDLQILLLSCHCVLIYSGMHAIIHVYIKLCLIIILYEWVWLAREFHVITKSRSAFQSRMRSSLRSRPSLEYAATSITV